MAIASPWMVLTLEPLHFSTHYFCFDVHKPSSTDLRCPRNTPRSKSFTAPHPSPTHHRHHQLTTAAEILSREKVISDMPVVVCLAASASHLSGFARPAPFFHFYLFTTFLAKRNQTSSPGTEPMKIVTWLPARGWVLPGGKQFRQLILHPMCPVRRVATSSLVLAPNAHPIAWSQMRELVKANHISDETEDRRYGRE